MTTEPNKAPDNLDTIVDKQFVFQQDQAKCKSACLEYTAQLREELHGANQVATDNRDWFNCLVRDLKKSLEIENDEGIADVPHIFKEIDQLKAEREELKKKLLNSCDIKHFLLVKDQLAAWKEMANESVTVIRDTPFNSSKRDAVVEKFNQMKEESK